MKNLTKTLLLIALSLSMTSCAFLEEATALPENGAIGQGCMNDHGEYYPCHEESEPDMLAPVAYSPMENNNRKPAPSLYNIKANFQIISEYTERMAMEIKQDTKHLNIKENIAVASFVYFDDNLKSTSPLGNQLAEYFINDLQNIGLPVSDHKLSSGLIVNERGDFSLSRNINELNGDIEIGYVLTGTMIQNYTGVVVNARLISRSTNKVIASSSKLIPNLLIEDML